MGFALPNSTPPRATVVVEIQVIQVESINLMSEVMEAM